MLDNDLSSIDVKYNHSGSIEVLNSIVKTAAIVIVSSVALAILVGIGIITTVSLKVPLIILGVSGLVGLIAYRILNASGPNSDANQLDLKEQKSFWLSPINFVNSLLKPAYTIEDGLTLLKQQIFEGKGFEQLSFFSNMENPEKQLPPSYAVLFVDIVADGKECIAHGTFSSVNGGILDLKCFKEEIRTFIDSLQSTPREAKELPPKYSFTLAMRDAQGIWSYALSAHKNCSISELTQQMSSSVKVVTGVTFKAISKNMENFSIRNLVGDESELNI